MSQLNASWTVHSVLNIKVVVVSRLVRGLILRHRGTIVLLPLDSFRRSPELSTSSPWTGRIPARRPAEEGLHGDCNGPASQPGDIVGDPRHSAASEDDEVTYHVGHSPVAHDAVSSQG